MGLHEKELWKKFHEAGTEMIITKAGRSALGRLTGVEGDSWDPWGSPGAPLPVLSPAPARGMTGVLLDVLALARRPTTVCDWAAGFHAGHPLTRPEGRKDGRGSTMQIKCK